MRVEIFDNENKPIQKIYDFPLTANVIGMIFNFEVKNDVLYVSSPDKFYIEDSLGEINLKDLRSKFYLIKGSSANIKLPYLDNPVGITVKFFE